MKRAELLERLYLRLPRVTALIGGGGKTTLLSALGETCARRGERVLLTTRPIWAGRLKRSAQIQWRI